MSHALAGLHVPLVTPFALDGSVDLEALERLAVGALDDGATGLVALGTTGEPATLSASEQDAIVDRCVAICCERGAWLTVGCGGNDTAAAAREAERRGSQPGVDALLSVVPPYTRPSTDGVLAHFTAVADASPVPLVVYEHPGRSGIRFGVEALLRLHATSPSVIGVKLAVPALDADALGLLAEAPPSFAVLAGEDQLVFGVTMAGGAGAICAAAHCTTRRFADLLAAVDAGDVIGARAHDRALRPLVAALFAEPNPAVIKGVLHAQGLIATPDVRLPLVRASGGAVERSLAALGAAEGVRG